MLGAAPPNNHPVAPALPLVAQVPDSALSSIIATAVAEQVAAALRAYQQAQPVIAAPPNPPPVVPAEPVVAPAPLVGPFPFPPPPLPPVGVQPYPPPSHLNNYPPPSGLPAGAANLLAASQQPASVSSQSAHLHLGGHHSPIYGDIAIHQYDRNTVPIAAARPLDFDTLMSALPKGLSRAVIAPSKEPPTNAAQFKTYLDLWWKKVSPQLHDNDSLIRIVAFIESCKTIADQIPTSHVLKYFVACQEAHREGDYNYKSPTHPPAYMVHVSPYLGQRERTSSSFTGKAKRPLSDRNDPTSRKAARSSQGETSSADRAPSALCYIHLTGATRHTNQQCRSQHPDLPKPSPRSAAIAAST